MYRNLRRLLFALPPECAHDIALRALPLLPRPAAPPAGGGVRLMGLDFPNRVGLAAGFDKTGAHASALAGLGFGFVETGTFTPAPQRGNPKPRLFRLERQESLVNRMGFNNPGAEQAARNLATQRKGPHILGINIGKGAATPVEDAGADYLACLDALHQSGDYFALNVSSPNTPSLRDLQAGKLLAPLLKGVVGRLEQLGGDARRKPVLVKISPDWEDDSALRETCAVVADCGIDGVIATNTTVGRPEPVRKERHADEKGGLSGRALAPLSEAVLAKVRAHLPREVALVAAGGIFGPEDARRRLGAGADLVQVYTGLVYEGPALVKRLVRATGTSEDG